MGERSDEIVHEIDQKRAELGSNLRDLEHRVKSAVDWRSQFSQHPITMIGIAFGGGILLSQLGSGRSRHNGRPGDALSRLYEGRSAEVGNVRKVTRRRSGDTWDNIRTALVAVAGARVQSFLNNVVPGFNEEFQRVKERRQTDPSMGRATALDDA
jgi:hypothetical protein